MLELLAKNHSTWLQMVLGFGCSRSVAEDIVQSMYLRMHKYIKDKKRIMYNDDEVNKFFIYVTLKNMYKTYVTSKNKYSFYEIREDDSVEYELEDFNMDADMEDAFIRLMGKINEEISTWHKYDKILSEKYLKTDYSLRDIASLSGISLTSIYNSMKYNKKVLKDKFNEDWLDFKNGDYDLI